MTSPSLDRRHNILFLIPTFADAGGTQKMVCELSKMLSKDHVVYECSFNALDEPHFFISGNKVLSLDIPAPKSLLKKTFAYLKAARNLRRLKKQYEITLTISNLWAADLLNILSGGNDYKISIGHGSIVGFKGNRLLLRFRHFAACIYKRFDRVVSVNKYLERELKSLFDLAPHQLTTINNFVSFPELDIAQELKAKGLMRLITVGRLDILKNHAALIEIFAAVRRSMPSTQLVIVGSGSEEEALKALASGLGLSFSDDILVVADIVFTGFQSNPFPLLQSSDLFVFPSRTEGLPLVLVEAMYSGLPVITSDCPAGGPSLILEAIGEYIEGRSAPLETAYGFLMPIPKTGDSQSTMQWADVICKLLANETKICTMRRNVRKRAMDFSAENAYEEWNKLIFNLK